MYETNFYSDSFLKKNIAEIVRKAFDAYKSFS